MFHGLYEILLDRCVSLLFHGLFLGDCSIADKLTPARTGSVSPDLNHARILGSRAGERPFSNGDAPGLDSSL